MKKYSLFYDHNMHDSNELYCKIPEKKKDDSYSIFHKYVNFNKSNILIVGNSNFHVHNKMRGREMLMPYAVAGSK